MKNVYSLLTKMLFLSLFMALPLMFFGQENAKGDETQKTQTTSNFSPYWFLQADYGASWAHAEVATTTFVPDFRSNVFVGNGNLAFGRQLKSWLSVYGNITRGYAKGRLWSQKNTYSSYTGRNLWFTSDYYGADANLGVNVSDLLFGVKDRKWYVGVHAGLGQIQWKSKLYSNGTFLVRHGYSGNNDSHNGGISNRKIALSVPVGANLNYKFNDQWTFFGDYTYTWLDTDILDGVVDNYGIAGHDGIVRANIGARFNLNAGSVNSMTKKMLDTKQDAKPATEQGLVNMHVTPEVLVEKGGMVNVAIDGTFPPKYFNKKAVMLIQPVLKYEGGELALDPIKLKGEEVAGEGQLISYDNGGSFKYNASVPYKEGMDVAELSVAPVVYAYDGQEYNSVKEVLAANTKAVQMPAKKLADGTVHTDQNLMHAESMAFAPHGYKKVTVSTQEANLYFQVNLAKLNWKLPLNKNEENYNKLKNNLSDLDKGWAVKGIDIEGWASPEGEETFNQGLSQHRAETAAKYLKNKIKRELRKKGNAFAFKSVKDIAFTANANGPDWNGFMKAVKASNIADKAAILNVVNSADESKKEAEIRNMIQIYPELERDILPPLRRAIIKVSTFEPKRTDAEIAALSTSPNFSELKLNELMYAATLTNDLNTKKQIYANAMAKEPRCWRAVANAGAVELELGNLDAAKALLQKAKKMNGDAYQVYNSCAILHAKMGDFKMAEKGFKKAQSLGADETYNLGLVDIMKGDYASAVNALASSKCDYNLGLAQLLNGDYAAATNTLKCAKETAQTDYLLAVVGARQQNKAMMLENLTKAVKADAAMAAKASRDREFIQYFNEPDFKALVNAK
jgi:outer membrane protein OmpA-like peptidoglycan-associated protein/Flp pilus assembly protein TadD